MSRHLDLAPVLVALTPAGAALARRLAATLPGAQVHGRAGRVGEAEADTIFEDTGAHLRALFDEGRPIVGVCAAGVLIRALASALADKTAEPPVVAIAEDGSAVVPLVGGHRGANDLARALAAALGVGAAITTAGDIAFGLALDDPPTGWRLANPEDCKAFAAALLAGARVRLDDEVPAPWLRTARLPLAEDGALVIRAGASAVAGGPKVLVYHPAVLAVGVGCARGAPPAEAVALVCEALAAHGLAPAAVGAVVSIDLKADEPAVHAVAAALGVPARFYPPARLEAERPRLANPSDVVFREVGCHGVAEGAALAAAGPASALVVPKVKSAAATCAVARAPAPLDPFALGRGRGRLRVVGLGPGDPAWRAPEATRALRAASDIVGYGAYLDLLGGLAATLRYIERRVKAG
ncbi:MAG: cobalamin biosynthesis protein, partial [Kiloniellaceae bacterium]